MLPREPVSASYPPTKPIPTEKKTFALFAALVWGSVMWLFKNKRQNLQAGLVNSMDCTSLVVAWQARTHHACPFSPLPSLALVTDLYVNAEKWQE